MAFGEGTLQEGDYYSWISCVKVQRTGDWTLKQQRIHVICGINNAKTYNKLIKIFAMKYPRKPLMTKIFTIKDPWGKKLVTGLWSNSEFKLSVIKNVETYNKLTKIFTMKYPWWTDLSDNRVKNKLTKIFTIKYPRKPLMTLSLQESIPNL